MNVSKKTTDSKEDGKDNSVLIENCIAGPNLKSQVGGRKNMLVISLTSHRGVLLISITFHSKNYLRMTNYFYNIF
jgi:hypothetical protein